MILDILNNAKMYESLHPGFAKAFAFLRAAQDGLPEVGRYEIDGDKVFALVQKYDTVPAEEAKWEAHKKYIDIQFVYDGSEIIGWDTISNLPEGETFIEEKDSYRYHAPSATPLILHSGMFAILYPQDLHRPKELFETASPVVKIVVKVLL